MISEAKEKDTIRLKGMGDGLWINIDPARSLDSIREDLKQFFSNLKHSAVDARIVLDTGRAEGDEKLIQELGAFLKESFQVATVTGPPPKRSPQVEKARQRDIFSSWQYYRSDVLMLTGRVRSGQKVNAREHVIILGDVNPGAQVVAGGDVLVLGSLCGTVSAGQPDSEDAIVFALDFRPTQVRIGNVVAAGLPPPPEKKPEYAHVEKNIIVVEDYMKANPFARLPWPEVR